MHVLVCVCVYVCVHLYLYIYIYTCTCTHTYLHGHQYMYMYCADTGTLVSHTVNTWILCPLHFDRYGSELPIAQCQSGICYGHRIERKRLHRACSGPVKTPHHHLVFFFIIAVSLIITRVSTARRSSQRKEEAYQDDPNEQSADIHQHSNNANMKHLHLSIYIFAALVAFVADPRQVSDSWQFGDFTRISRLTEQVQPGWAMSILPLCVVRRALPTCCP